jgi:hypothetical protein
MERGEGEKLHRHKHRLGLNKQMEEIIDFGGQGVWRYRYFFYSTKFPIYFKSLKFTEKNRRIRNFVWDGSVKS